MQNVITFIRYMEYDISLPHIVDIHILLREGKRKWKLAAHLSQFSNPIAQITILLSLQCPLKPKSHLNSSVQL